MNAAKPGHTALVLFMALGVNGTARAEAPHEHGIALLQIAIAGSTLEATLQVPAPDVVGFEHAPRTDAERAAIASAVATLREAAVLPPAAARCGPAATTTDAAPGMTADDDPHGAAHTHADFVLRYRFDCADLSHLEAATTALFERLPSLGQLRVQAVSANGAVETLLTRPERQFRLP